MQDGLNEAPEPEVEPLTREQAQQWRKRQPRYSLWAVLGWQVMLAALVTGLTWLISADTATTVSALYGAVTGLLPTAVMAWGLTSGRWTRRSAKDVQASLAGFFLWEGVKLLLALAMLWSAPRLVADLSWLALVVGLVVVLKAYGLALWFQTRARPTNK